MVHLSECSGLLAANLLVAVVDFQAQAAIRRTERTTSFMTSKRGAGKIPATIKAAITLTLSVDQHIAHGAVPFGPTIATGLENRQGVVVHEIRIRWVRCHKILTHDTVTQSFQHDVTSMVT